MENTPTPYYVELRLRCLEVAGKFAKSEDEVISLAKKYSDFALFVGDQESLTGPSKREEK